MLYHRVGIAVVFYLYCAGIVGSTWAQDATGDRDTASQSLSVANWNLHFQQTVIPQWHPAFTAKYTGANSLKTEEETEMSLTSTLFCGIALWKGAEIYGNLEMSGGSGISGARGIAGFTNGEAFRIGSAVPVIYPARFYIKQVLNAGGGNDTLEDDINQIGVVLERQRWSIALGKFGLADFFDNNSYSHDPRTQFLNWSLMSYGAWDYPADTRGYTWGAVIEYEEPDWAIRFGAALMPKEANGLVLDTRIKDANGLVVELERHLTISGRPGIIRGLLYRNSAHAGNYRKTITTPSDSMNIENDRMYGRTKYGLGLSLEQEISNHIGIFSRLSWNDGLNETWAFTEIDRSFSVGALLSHYHVLHMDEQVGCAVVVNGISHDHADYLAHGGYGFIIGDGALSYAAESIVETFCNINITSAMTFTPDYQFVLHPAYNSDRGPAHVAAIRMHVQL